LKTLVDEWAGLTNDERKRVLRGIIDSITATAKGVDRLEVAEEWPFMATAIQGTVPVLRAPTQRKTVVKDTELVNSSAPRGRPWMAPAGWLEGGKELSVGPGV
jgi:hypothetical protein